MKLDILTLYNLIFDQFYRKATIVYWIIDTALIGEFFNDPLVKLN